MRSASSALHTEMDMWTLTPSPSTGAGSAKCWVQLVHARVLLQVQGKAAFLGVRHKSCFVLAYAADEAFAGKCPVDVEGDRTALNARFLAVFQTVQSRAWTPSMTG